MFKFLFDSFVIKGYLITGAILMGIIMGGKMIKYVEDSKPVKVEPWLPRIDYEKETLQKRKPSYNYNRKQPWRNEQKEQTENWADFLEDLENRGYTIYDPEAEDIWEEFY